MGAEVGKPVSNLAITSMAVVTPTIELKEMTNLKTELMNISKQKGTEMIAKKELDDSLKKAGKFDTSDLDVFAQLFILFDFQGDDTVNWRDYLAGIVTCLTSITLTERLKFALNIYDIGNAGSITKADLRRLLRAVNFVASYFGDPVLSLKDVEEVNNGR